MKIKKCKELVPHAATTVEDIHKLQEELRHNLIFFNHKIKEFINRKRVKELTLKKGNKVYLLRRIPNTKIIFIWTTRPSNKLDFAKLGSFKIIKVLELIIYKLDLPDSMKITRVRHVLVLKLVDPEAPLIKNILNINPKS